MFGLTTSQAFTSIVILASIVLYFAANTGIQQNAFIYIFSIAVTCLVVGT